MSKSLENLLSIMLGESPNGTAFAERERERERERLTADHNLSSRAREIKKIFRSLYITAVSFLMICGFFYVFSPPYYLLTVRRTVKSLFLIIYKSLILNPYGK
jgi:hypothetical protein